MDKQPLPKTMIEAVRQFADPQKAHDFFADLRWPNGVACPRMGCGSAAVAYLTKHRRWYCNECKRQFTAKVGTIFEDSPIGFDKWLPAIWLIASNRNGISSCELARALKVTQKSAWHMLHRIREAMRDDAFDKPDFAKMTGPVEADETYIGGKARSTKRHPVTGHLMGTGPQANKTIVMGIVQRKGRKGKVRAFIVPGSYGSTLRRKVRDHVEEGATIYTDAWPAYADLQRDYKHYVVNHAIEYARGHVHTNSIESFWAVLKRALKGTYIAPRPWHLQKYVEEEVFRFNERENTDGPRFALAAKGADGKRLTYRELVAQGRVGRANRK